MHPGLTYRISHRHQRTLLLLQIKPALPHHIEHPPRLRLSGYGSELEERDNSGRQKLVHNSFMFDESRDQLEYNLKDLHFMEERVSEIEEEGDDMG
jgi:hypothetical protein